ncbi:MAG: polysaccharide biosynthesis protein [Planctomycetales bacterium]|nr:polysaccharide biosynthesis protein [Planctomycetales bacterium]
MNQAVHRHLPILRLALFAALGGASYVAAYLLRFAGEITELGWAALSDTLLFAVVVKVAAAGCFRLHHVTTRYITLHDGVNLVKAATAATVALMLCDAMLAAHVVIPRSVVVLDWGTSVVLLGAWRGLPRFIRDARSRHATGPDAVRVLIVGANDAGEALLRGMRGNDKLSYAPVGFVDDRPRTRGLLIAGVPVLGGFDELPDLIETHGVEEVLIIAGVLPGRMVRDLMDSAADGAFRVKVLPSYEQLLNDNVALKPRPVAIGDLLRRASVNLDAEHAQQWLGGKTVLVTGSAGSIGSEICRQLLQLKPARLVLVDRSETGQFFLERELRTLAAGTEVIVTLADLTDAERLNRVFADAQPDIVFHAAAYKHVPLMEQHPGEAVKNIAAATRNLADLADEYGAEAFVMISTDKAVNPTSVMGACKRVAEQYVQARAASSDCRFVTVRFGNVLDSAGSVVPIFREQIAAGGPVTVTHPDMVRYFMLIPEAAQLVIQAGAMGQGGEIFVLDMGEPVRIVDLAADMIRLSGLRVGEDVEIKFTGLRPGEKLYEELYGDSEANQPTAHPKIMVAASQPLSLLQAHSNLARLVATADEPRGAVLAELRSIIPMLPSGAKAAPLRAAA